MAAAPRQRTLAGRGWRYTLIGAICALSNYAILLAVDFLGGHYLLGVLVGFLIVTPLGYALHSWFTFSEPFSRRAFLRFAAVLIAAYPIATGMLIILCSGLNLSVAIAYPIAVVGMFAWNFVAVHWSILPRLEFAPATRGESPPKQVRQ